MHRQFVTRMIEEAVNFKLVAVDFRKYVDVRFKNNRRFYKKFLQNDKLATPNPRYKSRIF